MTEHTTTAPGTEAQRIAALPYPLMLTEITALVDAVAVKDDEIVALTIAARRQIAEITEALHEAANEETLDPEGVDQLLEDLGLEARVREFTVSVRLTYDIEVSVEAKSAEEAQYKVENDEVEFDLQYESHDIEVLEVSE